jgi:tryptophan-rich sensory protein
MIAIHLGLGVVWFTMFTKGTSGVYAAAVAFPMFLFLLLGIVRVGKYDPIAMVFLLPYVMALSITVAVDSRDLIAQIGQWKGFNLTHCAKLTCP